MALVLADRIQETTTTTGTGTVTLLGAVQGFQSFSAVGNANTTYYTIAGQGTSEWEVGLGTYTSSGTTLSRTTVLGSSNAGSLVNFSAGTKNVFVTYPASQAVLLNGTQTLTAKTLTSPTITGAVVSSMASSVLTSATAVNTTSGTSIDFTSIPSWVKRITVVLSGISGSSTSSFQIQLGTTSGVTTTGYSATLSSVINAGATVGVAFTSGFGLVNSPSAASAYSGQLIITLLDSTSNFWGVTSTMTAGGTTTQVGGGGISLASTLTRLRLTTVNGTDTFDAGKVNILYE
jgi:hypothetical protein